MSVPSDVTREIETKLSDLKARVRRYVLLEGFAIVVAIIGVGFWLTYAADEVHFSARRLELPKWLRIGLTTLIAGLAVAALVTWVLGRLWTRFGQRMLALLLERRFPQLGDRLITAIELKDAPRAHDSPLADVMWQRTAAQAADALKAVDLNDVFNPRPLKRALIVAGVMLASITVMGAANAAGMQRWINAFLLGRENYWEPFRRSEMSVFVIADPGKRVRQFDANGVYRHPRGADLVIEAETVEGKAPPDRASLSFRSHSSRGASRGSTPMSRQGEGRFRTTLARVIDDHELWITAGDFVNRRPLRIEIVDPPRLDQLKLLCDYPSYTGLDAIEDKPVSVQSLQTSLPMETAFVLHGKANKPLVGAILRSELFELRFGKPGSGDAAASAAPSLLLRDGTTAGRSVTIATGKSWLSANGLEFQVPFRMTLHGAAELAKLADGAAPPLPLPPIAPLQILLEDQDGVLSTDPTNLTITGIQDLDPVVEARLSGVSNVVTRLADLPFRGKITDDYGVNSAQFGFEILPEPSQDPQAQAPKPETRYLPLRSQPKGQREFVLGADDADERFSLTLLELKDGQRLQLSIYADDGDTINGPHRARGEMFTFRIVPGEELLARLYEKELNLRQRFEQIINETRRMRDDLKEHEGRLVEWREARMAGDMAKTGSLQNAIDASARRSLHQARTNQTECRAIEVAFGEIRAEMVNNRVDTPPLLERIDKGVVEPLHAINETDYPELDGLLALFALAMERQEDPGVKVEASREAVDRLITRMEKVLSEMRRRGNVNEVIQQLQTIIERQKKLREATEQRKLDELFEGIGVP